MLEYWSLRLADAVKLSGTAPTAQHRRVHRQTAAHYRSLLRFYATHDSPALPDRLAA